MILATTLLLAAFQPGANCSALAPRLTPAVRRADAARVASLSGQRTRQSDVSYVLTEGNWRLVFATPRERERGVFVMRRSPRGNYRLVETWGGVVTPDDERGDVARWARALPGGGVPARLARCMEQAIVAGR